jgi:ribosomal protein S18 acetylase RimI-like enzyme
MLMIRAQPSIQKLHTLFDLCFCNHPNYVPKNITAWWQHVCMEVGCYDHVFHHFPALYHDINDELLGFLMYESTQNQSFFIHYLAVHPQWRRQGIATKLLTDARDCAKKKGARVIELEVDHMNEDGYKFFKSHHFF